MALEDEDPKEPGSECRLLALDAEGNTSSESETDDDEEEEDREEERDLRELRDALRPGDCVKREREREKK